MKQSSGARADATPKFGLLICTYNRAPSLREALSSALRQSTGDLFSYEVIVVDNNSTDDTARVVDAFLRDHPGKLRYVFEPTQGKSHALNSGLAALRADYYSIVDDDFILPEDWLRRIDEGMRRYPDAAFFGGKVLPAWHAEPPHWLTSTHWAPLALADFGDTEFLATPGHQVCLLACTFRTQDVRDAGGYDGHLSVSKGRVGGVEDLDMLKRLWRLGRFGVYLPTVAFLHRVETERMQKAYHRRWHRGHGRSRAMMMDEQEAALPRIAGVPRYMYREAFRLLAKAAYLYLTGRATEAFAAESRLWFIAGYCSERWRLPKRSRSSESDSDMRINS